MAQKTQNEDSDCKIVPETITLCVNDCGLVGNPATNNMCQNCFKSTTSVAGSVMYGENSPRSRISPTRKAEFKVLAEPTTISVESCAGNDNSATGSVEFRERSGGSRSTVTISEKRRDLKISEFRPGGYEAVEREKTELPTVVRREVKRCSGCRKKVGLTGFRCRCGELFCSEHRYSDRHDCSYDYKAAGREAIARENPVVKAAKIVKF